jgi:hypothetical protein
MTIVVHSPVCLAQAPSLAGGVLDVGLDVALDTEHRCNRHSCHLLLMFPFRTRVPYRAAGVDEGERCDDDGQPVAAVRMAASGARVRR